VFLLICFSLVYDAVSAKAYTVDTPEQMQEMITKVATAYGQNPKTAIAIIKCESKIRQFDKKGNVLRGEVNPLDVGLFQINEKYHLADSEKMGIDIHSTRGNIVFGVWLMKKQGTTPWNWSKSCWGKMV